MELHYKATVDNSEWEGSTIEVDEGWKLKDLKRALIDGNGWDEKSKVSFFSGIGNTVSKQLALTTNVTRILPGNNEENPISVIVEMPGLQKYKESLQPAEKKPKLELPAAPSNEQVIGFVKACAEDNRTQEDSKDPCYPSRIDGTAVPVSNTDCMDPGDAVPTSTTSINPLIVVAQQNETGTRKRAAEATNHELVRKICL